VHHNLKSNQLGVRKVGLPPLFLPFCAEPIRTRGKRLTARLGADLVQKFVYCLTDALKPSRLGYRQIRTGNVPGFGGDLVPGDKVFRRRTMNSGPPLEIAEDQIHRVRNLRHEVVDVSIPVAIIGSGEEQLCVVVQKDEAHIVEGANRISAAEVTFQRLQQSAKSLRSAFGEGNDPGELGDFSLTGADTAGVLSSSRNCQLSFEIGQPSLQRRPAQFGRIGVKLTQLLDLLLNDRVAF
jgi:hypothetical protein